MGKCGNPVFECMYVVVEQTCSQMCTDPTVGEMFPCSKTYKTKDGLRGMRRRDTCVHMKVF